MSDDKTSPKSVVIKRYSNRKMYDTHAKRYITLEEISSLVREGAEVKVIDNQTGEDITGVTLSQIVVEKERRHEGILPRTFFTEVLQKSGRTMIDTARRLVSGWFGSALLDEDEIKRTVDGLVEAGKIARAQADDLKDALIEKASLSWKKLDDAINRRIEQSLARLSIPTRSDVERLKETIARLEAQVAERDGKKRRSRPRKRGEE